MRFARRIRSKFLRRLCFLGPCLCGKHTGGMKGGHGGLRFGALDRIVLPRRRLWCMFGGKVTVELGGSAVHVEVDGA